MEAGAVCCFGSFGLLVVLVLGSALLRAAVSLANTMIDPRKANPEPVDPFADWDWDGELEDEKPRRKKKEKAVPEPGMGKGMMIASTLGAATAFVAIVLAIFGSVVAEDLFEDDEPARIFVLVLFTLPFSFIGSALLLAAMLPTTFSRGLLVTFIYYFLTVILLVVVGGTIVGLLSL
jgi:hypothetical protein